MAVDVKPKRRNSEKRKEKSRDAARTRRSKETEIFSQLAHQLPISQNTLALLDKTSIIRLGITHLKLRKLFHDVAFAKPAKMVLSLPSCHPKVDHLFCRALDGFLMLVNKDGMLVFVTENINSHLGLAQVDLLGLSIFDFIHPCDHDEMQDILSNRSTEAKDFSRSIFLRMKCTLTSKGHSINIKSAYYKVIHCLPNAIPTEQQQTEPQNLSKTNNQLMSFTLLLCRSLFHPSSSDMSLDSRTFVSHHNMDMSFMYCDERFSALLGYKAKHLLGKSLYGFHHVLDAEAIEKSYKTLFSKGQCATGMYRFLANGGGYVWLETQSSVINNPRAEKDQFVVCIHFVVSEIECRNQIFSSVQQSSCSDETSEDLVDVAEVDETDTVDLDGDDDSDDEEMDDEAPFFMTESILKTANQDFSFSDKYQISYRSPAMGSPITDYSQLAPYISVEDTAFHTVPLSTTDSEITSLDCIVVDPDLDPGLAPQSENPLLIDFRKTTCLDNKPSVRRFDSAAKNAVALPSPVFGTRPAGFPIEESREFNSVGGSACDSRRLVQQDIASMLIGSSVLKNLLVKGEDTNYGYRLMETPAVLAAAVRRQV